MRALAAVALLYAALCAGLWMVPLFGILHAESAAVVAGIAFLAAGLTSVAPLQRGEAFRAVLACHLALLCVPWVLLTLSLLWAPNQGYAQGLLLFVAFTGPSVALAVSLAYAITGMRLRRPFAAFLGVTAGVLVLTPLFDLGLHPQFYHYNHVFGGVLGPIYDEELAMRPGLFAFRGLTLLWACAAFLYGSWRRGVPVGRRLLAAMGLVALTYAAGGWLGLNTPAWRLRQALPGHVQTAHFDVYFDPARLRADVAARVAREHEWRYAQLREALGVEVKGRVQSYLYPDARTRARHTGAAETSVAPVWLPQPQMHLLQQHLGDVLAHELAHVFSREFGLPVLRASRQVGLVEGLAVALEPPDGLPSPHEQVISAALATADTSLADRLARSLGAGGFWTGRGAVSYTTTGSFVRYLYDTYGAERLRAVYACGDFDAVYGKSVARLADEWVAALHRLDLVSVAAAPLARQRFSVPSLFEQRSPHYVPPHVRQTRRARQALAAGDTLTSLRLLERALGGAPSYGPALDLWATIRLARGEAAAVRERLQTWAGADPVLRVRLADATALLGEARAAHAEYARASGALPAYAHAAAVTFAIRQQWVERPDAIRALYQREPDPGATSATLMALRRMDRHPVDAYRLLVQDLAFDQGWPTPGARNRALAQQAGWQATAALAAGYYREAARHGREAARLFEEMGDRNAARLYLDLAAQADWAESTYGGGR